MCPPPSDSFIPSHGDIGPCTGPPSITPLGPPSSPPAACPPWSLPSHELPHHPAVTWLPHHVCLQGRQDCIILHPSDSRHCLSSLYVYNLSPSLTLSHILSCLYFLFFYYYLFPYQTVCPSIHFTSLSRLDLILSSEITDASVSYAAALLIPYSSPYI